MLIYSYLFAYLMVTFSSLIITYVPEFTNGLLFGLTFLNSSNFDWFGDFKKYVKGFVAAIAIIDGIAFTTYSVFLLGLVGLLNIGIVNLGQYFLLIFGTIFGNLLPVFVFNIISPAAVYLWIDGLM